MKTQLFYDKEQDLCDKMDCLRLFSCDDCSVNIPCVKLANKIQITMLDKNGDEHFVTSFRKFKK